MSYPSLSSDVTDAAFEAMAADHVAAAQPLSLCVLWGIRAVFRLCRVYRLRLQSCPLLYPFGFRHRAVTDDVMSDVSRDVLHVSPL
jgi:hypothetical protein